MKVLFSFKGRVSRQRWWLIVFPSLILPTIILVLLFLINPEIIVAGILIFLVFFQNFITGFSHGSDLGFLIELPVLLIQIFFGILYFVIIATNIKRFHDRNKSGWWVLVSFIPWIGVLWLLIECGFLKGTEGQNQYGPDPLAPEEALQPIVASQVSTVVQAPAEPTAPTASL